MKYVTAKIPKLETYSKLTSDCIMPCLCVRSSFTVWNRSTTPSYLILSRTTLSAMKTPVLPTPALNEQNTENVTNLCIVDS